MSLEPAAVAYKVQFSPFEDGLRTFVTCCKGTLEYTLGYGAP